MFNGMSTYASYCSHAAGGSVGAFGEGFGASHTTEQYQQTFNQEYNLMVTTFMYCSLYKTEFDTYIPPGFTQSFKNAINYLPETYKEGPYFDFFNGFGTHYIF